MKYDVKQPALWISMGVKVLTSHPTPCPFGSDRCVFGDAFWLAVEAASLALDMLAGPRPARTRPSWMAR